MNARAPGVEETARRIASAHAWLEADRDGEVLGFTQATPRSIGPERDPVS